MIRPVPLALSGRESIIYFDTMPTAMILIKLGGSVITDKSQYKKFDRVQAERLCREIADSGKEVIIVHGAGSFGHVLAKKYSIQNGYSDPEQIQAAAQVHHDAMELGMLMTQTLLDMGIPAASVSPGTCFVMDGGKLIPEYLEPIEALRKIGIMPVTFGDVVMDRTRGFGIVSGDQMMELMAEMFKPERVIFVSDIDDSTPRTPRRTLMPD